MNKKFGLPANLFFYFLLILLVFIAGCTSTSTGEALNIVKQQEPTIPQSQLFNNDAVQSRINEIKSLGVPISVSGVSEVIVFDDFENGRAETQYYVKAGSNKRYRVYFSENKKLLSGEALTVSGVALGNEIVSDSYYGTSKSNSSSTSNENLGVQETLVALVNFEK